MNRERRAVVLMAMLLMAATPGAAMAQAYVAAPCPAHATPAFVDKLQPLWYRRFWTGECRYLPGLTCRAGKPYWNDVVKTLVARAPAQKRGAVAQRACRLGRSIGFEWTRPSKVRRIDTSDLQALDRTLERADDVDAGLTAVEAAVRGKIR